MNSWIWERILTVVIGFGLDLILGDPQRLWHPVMGIGRIISGTEKRLRKIGKLKEEKEADKEKKLTAGGVLVLVTVVLSVGIPAALLAAAERISHPLRVFIEAFMCYRLLAIKSLRTESKKVYDALKEGDAEKARKAVSMIVGRDTDKLDEEGITKAAVETVAENTSDGSIAPLLFMLLFGGLGGFFYKAVNTMDSMVGYKNDRYLYFGRAAARLDDVLNFLPARISAWTMIGAAFFLGMDWKNAAFIYKRDRFCHASPNSAQTEAACAGALGVQLAGDAWYFGKLHRKPTIGDKKRNVEPEDIMRANRLLYGTSVMVLLGGILLLIGLDLSLRYG